MIFGWWKRRRRRNLLAGSMPDAWRDVIADGVWQYDLLDDAAKRRLEDATRILVAEKNWEGCGGFELTEEAKIRVAAQAALMTIGFETERFDRLQSVLIYPDAFVVPRRSPFGAGLVIEEEQELEGEAWYRGPVILSWAEVVTGGRDANDGRNLVFHEFAHQLDMLNGDADGNPSIDDREAARDWLDVTSKAYRELVRDCRRRGRPLLDCYGAESPAEFFAVASEAFFQVPDYLRREAPDLYRVLCRYYRQDPPWAGDDQP